MRHPRTRTLPSRALALSMVITLTSTACAGSVGRYRNAAPASGSQIAVDPETGQVVDPETGQVVDPETGQVVDPETGEVFDPETGQVIDEGGSGPGGAPAERESRSGPSGTQSSGGIGSTTGVTQDEIRIGLFYPKTGGNAGLLRGVPQVMQAAFDEPGRIHGRRLVVQTYDDGSGNASTIQAEERRAKDEVFAYISGSASANDIVAPLANQHRVPVILGNVTESVARPLRYAFPLFVYWQHQATILPGLVKNYLKAGRKRVGIAYEGTTVSKTAKDAFKAKARAIGLKVVYEQPLAENQSQCSNEVSNLQAHDVELVYLQARALSAICMMRDARSLGYRPLWTGVGASWDVNIVAQATGGAADGARTLGTYTTLETPAGKHYSEFMRESGNGEYADDDIYLIYYALARSIIEALDRAGGNLGREVLVRTFESKMDRFSSGYLPPPKFDPRVRSGPQSVSVHACCSENNRWYTEQPEWRTRY